MPIQITELNISVSVNQPGATTAVPPANPEGQQQEGEKMISECVEQVMKILKDKKER
jgi:hypothetical protein